MRMIWCTSRHLFFIGLTALLFSATTFAKDDDQPTDALSNYLEAMSHFSQYRYTAGLASFTKLEQYFPGTTLARKAFTMRMFIQYLLLQRETMPVLIDTFLRLYPSDVYAPYVHYMKAASEYRKIYVPGKGSESMIDVVYEDFAFIVKTYPGTIYATHADRRMQFLRNFKAMHRLRMAEHYHASGYFFDAIKRYNQILNTDNHDFKPIVLARLIECYDCLGMAEQVKRYKDLLHINFPTFPDSVKTHVIAGQGNMVSDSLKDDITHLYRRMKVFK